MITIKNKTRHPQSIHTFDGRSIIIEEDGLSEINEKEFFPEELKRIEKFFQIVEKKQRVEQQEKDIARTSKRKYEYEDGGKE